MKEARGEMGRSDQKDVKDGVDVLESIFMLGRKKCEDLRM